MSEHRTGQDTYVAPATEAPPGDDVTRAQGTADIDDRRRTVEGKADEIESVDEGEADRLDEGIEGHSGK